MSPTKILVTGATGFIGGSILTHLLKSENEFFKDSKLSALVRGADKAKILSELGVDPILFDSLDDSQALEKAASEHDIVIHTASGFHPGSAAALIRGLGKRKAALGGEPRYIHTSGTSNLADQPITGLYQESREFLDTDDIYAYLKMREANLAYPQRTTDLTVVETGREVRIKTYIIMSPTIYGKGASIAKAYSHQIPTIITAAIKDGYVSVVGPGMGIWNYVHIADLVNLYELLILHGGDTLPYGERGIYFSATGQYTWKELSQKIADAGFKLGALQSNQVKSIDLEEAAQKFADRDTLLTELCFSSFSRSKPVLAAQLLGWKPKKTTQDFEGSFLEEFSTLYKGNK